MVFAEACWGIKPPLQINFQKIKELKNWKQTKYKRKNANQPAIARPPNIGVQFFDEIFTLALIRVQSSYLQPDVTWPIFENYF